MPLNITIEPTQRCNLNCNGCFVGGNRNSKNEMGLKEWESVIKEALTFCRSFYIAGGEPFMRPDIFNLLEFMGSRKAFFGLTTNGTLLNSKMVKRLLDSGINYIIFSLDGLKKEHDQIRGSGNFDRTVRAIRLTVGQNKRARIFINTMINPLNYLGLANLPKLAKSLGVFGISLQHYVYLGRLEWPRLQESINAFEKNAKDEGIRYFYKPILNSTQLNMWYGDGFYPKSCIQPWSLIRINPSGGVYFCFPNLEELGSVKREPLRSIVNSRAALAFRRRLRSQRCFKTCLRCCKG